MPYGIGFFSARVTLSEPSPMMKRYSCVPVNPGWSTGSRVMLTISGSSMAVSLFAENTTVASGWP